MDVTETLTLIVVLISTALMVIKSNPDYVLFLKRSFIDIYCILSNKSGAEVFKELYFDLKAKNCRSANIYLCLQPIHFVADNELIKSILQTDFQYFTNRGFYFNKKAGIIDENILNSFHDEWRFARTKLSPAFTPAKMKKIIEQIRICANNMMQAINSNLMSENDVGVDIYDITVKYFANIASAFVLGVQTNSYQDERSQKFEKYASKLFTDKSLWRNCQLYFGQVFPKLAVKLGVSFAPKKTADFYTSIVDEIVNFRQQNNVLNDDLLKIMMDLRNKGVMTMEEITAQCLIFYIGNFETSSVAFTFCLYELAKNPTIQEKLRDEIIKTYEHDEELSYDTLKTMEYTGRVISETLRKYPPVHVISRRCTKDYKIPDSNTVIKKGTMTLFSILGLQNDPEYYPDPLKFDPDRFIPEVVESRPPFTYLPFGGGPRNCVGSRLASIQLKIGLSLLLKNYRFSLNENTVEPVTFKRFLLFLATQKKILLNVERI